MARLSGDPSHETVQRAIVALENLEHRGAAGADPNTGDGAGILLQMPDEFMRGVVGDALPERGAYGVCVCFLPQDDARRAELEALLEKAVTDEGQKVVGWRDIPVDKDYVGITANFYAPYIKHLIVAAQGELAQDHDAFERKLYVIRRVAELAAGPDLVIPSFSARTVVYKGMLTAPQLLGYYPDLQDPRTKSALALVHSRFSTNTFPSWELAHPYRMIAHNGEINTLRGNVNWMRARESQLASELFGDDLPKILPIVRPGGSDSATFDNVLELLTLAGRSLPHAVMMMIPEAYEGREDMPDDLRGFYAFHSCLMEPWDGPAAVAFTDGRVIGATLDRNGLRPGRWLETKDGWVVLGSETGVIDEPAENVLRKGRLQPGNIFLVDLGRGRIVEDGEVKREIASRRPYLEWFERGINHLADLTEREPLELEQPLRQLQFAFGYTQEDMKVLLAPTACKGEEPIGSMGNDLALAVLSDSHPPLFSYFKQLFAQVTNPPIDPIREAIVMSVSTGVGSERNLLDETPQHACQLAMKTPILRNHELENLRQVDSEVFKARTFDITWPVDNGPDGMAAALDRICAEADAALAEGVNVLILSDRATGPERVPMPSLLAVGGVHHHLVREGTRLQAGLVLESGEPREVHHFATLIGYGASAINPYLMFESLGELVAHGKVGGVDDVETAEKNVVKGIAKGLLKTISKMGISTVQSYNGAQIFEAVGLSSELIDRCFTGTASRIEGVGIDVLARESLDKHAKAFPMAHEEILPVGGVYAWRRDGEHHMWNPETIALLQHAVRHGGRQTYDEYSKLINDDAARRATLRGLLQFRELPEEEWLPLDEVEPAKEIVRRFATGAMSLGSLSREAHETLAIAMNRLGGRSNTGEGGEDPVRYTPDPNGDSRRSAIKQVASGRFGVNINYLVNSDELQIKMAQGAKPGEGGQLPGHKVDRYIGSIRFTTPGVGLISPPPHHDIYSIEDLKQLIYDLRCSNPAARVSVKLVSEVGVGTVAAGVAKANADHVLISGFDGAPEHPAELDPVGRRAVGDRPRRDAADARAQRPALAHLGADRRPDQDRPRRRGGGAAGRRRDGLLDRAADRHRLRDDARLPPQHVPGRDRDAGPGAAPPLRRHARARRQLLLLRRRGGARDHAPARRAAVRRPDRPRRPAPGRRRDRPLEGARDRPHARARTMPDVAPGTTLRRCRPQDSPLPGALDWKLIEAAREAIDHSRPVTGEFPIRNINRTVGGLLSSAVTKVHGFDGLPPETVRFTLRGSAGQSFGAWLAPGVELTLIGDANDYTGKGLSGGVLAVRPPDGATFKAEENVIIGNTVLYGATAGRAFFRGLAGERFAVRNSGASAVVEGVGDHGCEYMTGGRAVILGRTGRNFAAGMSGGVAYVLDEDGTFESRCNMGLVGFEEISEADAIELHELIEEHHLRTQSPVAARVLREWADVLTRFVKVMPHDYKRALRELAEAEAHSFEPAESTGGEGFMATERAA